MARKNPRGFKVPTDPILSALEAATSDETKAVELFEATRWGDAPKCAHCASDDVYRMTARDGAREKNYRWRCRGCGERYTVRTGSVFEETRLPMRVWAHAYWRAVASKKGVSALQIKRECAISYKSALFLMHRIRYAMDVEPTRPLSGEVEMDETYVGGKPRMKGEAFNPQRGFGTKKAQVVAMVERGGNMRYLTAGGRITAEGVEAAVRENADLRSKFFTDESPAYSRAGKMFEGGHGTTCHKRREYAKPGRVHSNTVESAFSLLKRGMYGTFHSVSKLHLHRYLAEFEFRWNWRTVSDGERFVRAVRAAEGRRLQYAGPAA